MAESPHPTVPVTQVVAPVVPQVASEITAHVDMTRGPEGIDVVLSRETATFRMPVSEGRLPAALAALVGRQAASAIQGVGEASLASFSEAISTARPATILLPAPEADPINAERAALAAQAVLEAADDASETASVHVNGVPYPSDLGGTQRATG